jgi:hypothetical protein
VHDAQAAGEEAVPLQFKGAMCRLLRRMYMADFPQKSGISEGPT